MTQSEIAPAVARLVDLARSNTGQARRAANVLLADLFGLDTAVAADIPAIVGFLAHQPGAIYPDAWGYRDAITELVARSRPAQAAA